MKISQKSLLTDEIAKADSNRDTLYAGYKNAVEGFLAMPITDMAQAHLQALALLRAEVYLLMEMTTLSKFRNQKKNIQCCSL